MQDLTPTYASVTLSDQNIFNQDLMWIEWFFKLECELNKCFEFWLQDSMLTHKMGISLYTSLI